MFFLHLVAKRQGGQGSESGAIPVRKIPDSDCMGKHFSGAEHTAELLWIFGSSFCCHPLWRISSWHHGRKNDQKNLTTLSDADKKLTQADWYEQASTKHRLGIRRQFLRSRVSESKASLWGPWESHKP